MIAHHSSLTSIALELAVIVGLVVGFGALWLRERRRRLRRDGSATMRDEV